MESTLYQVVRTALQAYLAMRGFCRPSDAHICSDAKLFAAINVCDEIRTCIDRGGMDEHAHHIISAVSVIANLKLYNAAITSELRAFMRTTFYTLLQNELVTPFFNTYALMKIFGSPARYRRVILCATIPMLAYRFHNSLNLIRTIKATGAREQEVAIRSFKIATTLLCLSLMTLDVIWIRWAVRRILKQQ